MPDCYLVGMVEVNGRTNVVGVRPIVAQEETDILAAIQHVTEFGQNHSLHIIYHQNLDLLFDFWSQTVERYAQSQIMNPPLGYKLSIEFTRHLMNFLTSHRSFLDHWRARLKRIARRSGSNLHLSEFEDVVLDLKNNSFPFLFFAEFRNYVQHIGLPPFDFAFGSSVSSSSSVLHKSEVYLNRDSLLAAYDWKDAESRLKLQPEKIDLISHLDTLRKDITRISRICIDAGLSVVKTDVTLLQGIYAEVENKVHGAIPCIGYFESISADNVQTNFHPFPMHILSLIDNLHKSLTATP